jgi:hypothetical protein
MALSAPLKVSDQALIIQQVLQSWAEPKGGVAVVASNLRDFWKQAATSSQKPRILICYNGDNSRGDFAHANDWHRVDRQWIVAVTRGRGFTANRGDTLSTTVGNMEPFYDSVEAVRDQIRTILNISEELPTVDYKSTKAMQLGDLVVDGYTIEFSCANDIPMILTQPDNSPN